MRKRVWQEATGLALHHRGIRRRQVCLVGCHANGATMVVDMASDTEAEAMHLLPHTLAM